MHILMKSQLSYGLVSSLELVKGDVSTLIHQMELTYVSYEQRGRRGKLALTVTCERYMKNNI